MFSEDTARALRSKLLLLYVFKKAAPALTMPDIEEIVLPTKIIGLLEIPDVMVELIEAGLIDELSSDEYTLYSITDEGMQTIDVFADKINSFHKRELDELIRTFRRERENVKFVSASYKKVAEDSSIVSCKIKESGGTLIELNIRVLTNEQAEKMVERWKQNALDIFQGIVKMLEVESE